MTLGDLRILVDRLPHELDGCQVMLGIGEYFSEQIVVQPMTDGGETLVFISSVENEAELPYWGPVDSWRS